MSEPARILLSHDGINFEISGSETFVTSQVELFRSSISQVLERTRLSVEAAPTSTAGASTTPPADGGEKFANVFHADGSGVKITARVTGGSKAEKTVNTALLMILGRQVYGLGDSVGLLDIRKACKDQGCLDGNNFSKHIKGATQTLVKIGSGASGTVKLSVPGLQQAKLLAQSLNGSANS